MSLAKKYQRKIYKHYKMLSVWPVGIPLQLGDVIQKVRGVYRRISHISEIDNSITFSERVDSTSDGEVFNDNGGVIISTKLKGDAAIPNTSIGINDVGALVEFESKNSVYLKANKIRYVSIEDQIRLGNQVVELYTNGGWEKDWFVVTELAKAESGTIILSSSTNARIEIKAKAEGTINEVDLANAELELSAGFNRGIGAQTIAKMGLTPLFRISGLKLPWFADPAFEPTHGVRAVESTLNTVKNDKSTIGFKHLTADDILDDEMEYEL